MSIALKNIFAEHGYNLVSLPKSDIKPLLLLYKVGSDVSSAQSQVTTLFPADEIPAPAIKKNIDVMPIVGKAEVAFDAKAGLNFLEGLLSNFKKGKAAAKIKISDEDVLTFSFQDIKEDSIDLLALDRFISGTAPDISRFTAFGEKLKKSELFIINAVLKSTSFTIKITDKSGQDVDVEAQIKGMAEANVKMSRAKNNSITLSHKDEQLPLIFAFRAQRIKYDQPAFWSTKKAKFRIIDQPDVVLRDTGNIVTEPLLLGLYTTEL
ncbi:gasdermin [Mucilaginibacter rubeus]|uniref:gasdermin n=1 Tax=Mucilaginibacter rubeus TaxID=2027860 RepID=UPI001665511F|nr:hypothetical protein [Mucilaginibacter rubeus]GGA95766.1 hypothetical protein GCM10011500_09430 [Mucilaginibacter rubeus]